MSSLLGDRIALSWQLWDTPYGEIFDAITPDFEKQQTFKRALSAYKVAILVGQYEKNPAMAKILIDYVKNGGTLVMNARQLTEDYPEDFTGIKAGGEFKTPDGYVFTELKPVTARVLCREENKIVYTSNEYGKGRLIIGAPHYLVPDFGAEEANSALQAMRSGQWKFKYVKDLMDCITPGLLPVKVEGDIQYGVNKVAGGWWLYLFNNKGVTKFADSAATFDPRKRATVSGRSDKLGPCRVTDLVSGEAVAGRTGSFRMDIDPGTFRILKLEPKP
jgi:hypothetical protein